MKKIFASLLVLVALAANASAADVFPSTLAGFTLGDSVRKYESFCNISEATPMSDAPFLTEALIKPDALPGVRGGSLIYGNCKNKDRLVRIKLKFNDRSKDLFDTLMEAYKQKFGKPDSYQGDTFKNVIAWEWTFSNDAGEKIAVLVMWSRDKEMRPGVSIKMTNTTLYDAEYDCFKEQDYGFKKGDGSKIKSLDMYVPR